MIMICKGEPSLNYIYTYKFVCMSVCMYVNVCMTMSEGNTTVQAPQIQL